MPRTAIEYPDFLEADVSVVAFLMRTGVIGPPEQSILSITNLQLVMPNPAQTCSIVSVSRSASCFSSRSLTCVIIAFFATLSATLSKSTPYMRQSCRMAYDEYQNQDQSQ